MNHPGDAKACRCRSALKVLCRVVLGDIEAFKVSGFTSTLSSMVASCFCGFGCLWDGAGWGSSYTSSIPRAL